MIHSLTRPHSFIHSLTDHSLHIHSLTHSLHSFIHSLAHTRTHTHAHTHTNIIHSSTIYECNCLITSICYLCAFILPFLQCSYHPPVPWHCQCCTVYSCVLRPLSLIYWLLYNTATVTYSISQKLMSIGMAEVSVNHESESPKARKFDGSR